MISLQTNVNSLIAQQNLSVNSAFQAKTIEQLTSGYRINSSGDDAAGLAVANKYRNTIAELTQGVLNGGDAKASLNVMDRGVGLINKMLDTLKKLATTSVNGIFAGGVEGRATLNAEFQANIQEIDREAQSIGLNGGGTFAKSMAIYLGAGSGSSSQANAIVTVDLSKSTVDAQSLGLKGVQAVNSNNYDLSASSSTSVHAILNDTGNNATAGNPIAATTFTFFGAGFSNEDATTNNKGVTISVNLSGVGDTNTLVNAVNAAIQVQSQLSTGQASAFKAANIQASVVTDATGNQKLAFTSATSAFEANANDKTSNALTGNFVTGTATGAEMGKTTTAGSVMASFDTTDATTIAAAAATAGTAAADITLTFTFAGVTGTSPITLTGDYSAVASNDDIAAVITTDINSALAGKAKVTASIDADGKLSFAADRGMTVTASDSASGVNLTTFGLESPTVLSDKKYGTMVSGGSFEMASTTTGAAVVSNFKWAAAVTSAQSISITAADSTGASHPLTVNLDNASGATIDKAIGEINDKLQTSNDSTLQQITAVKVREADGQETINFVSTLNNFSVALGIAAGEGITNATGQQGKTTQALQIGAGGSADISTLAGAQAAVKAVTQAVTVIGNTLAAIGRSLNQVASAVDLANSQITSFSAAESQIRDTDVAAQAANLSKAQTLSQASIAAMAQANSAPQAVLSLLRG